MKEFENRVIQAMHITDENERENEIKKIILDLNDFFSKIQDYNQRIILLCDMNMDLQIKAAFFMESFELSYKAPIYKMGSGFLYRNWFDRIAIDDKHKAFREEFLILLNTDRVLQKEFVNFFKRYYYLSMVSYQNSLSRITGLPEFQKMILNDETFICEKLGFIELDEIVTHFELFFENLPSEYGYLICLIRTGGDLNSLYNKYFGKIIEEKTIEELCTLQQMIHNKPDHFRLSGEYKMRKIKRALINILNDNRFYQNMKVMQARYNLDLETIVEFAYNYYNTVLYMELICTDKQPTDEMKQKLKYLAKEEKLKDADKLTLAELESIPFEMLSNKRKDIEMTTIKSNVVGGPDSNTLIHFLPAFKEVVVIAFFPDGTVRIQEGVDGNHFPLLEAVYGKKFLEKEKNTQAIAKKAMDAFSSITWTIQNEICFFYCPNRLTIEQKQKVVDLLKTANEAGKVGILIYDLNEGWCIGKKNNDFYDKEGFSNAKTATEYVLNDIEEIEIEELKKRVSINGPSIEENMEKSQE